MNSKDRPAQGFATRAVHGAGLPPVDVTALSVPIYQSATFGFDDAEQFAHALRQPNESFAYSRYRNPTTAVLEATVAELEGGRHAVATASGMGAISSVLLSLATHSGDHLVVQRELYGGTVALLDSVLSRYGVRATYVDATDTAAVKAALRPETRAVYVETIANPTMTVADLPALAEVAAGAGVALVVDNTVASPYLCRPLEHGATVVLHSATKYLGGHSDVVAGIAVFADAERHAAVWKNMLNLGASPDPFAAWLLLRGLKTLPLRMDRQITNARALAELLEEHPKVGRVYWPGLSNHPSHGLGQRLLDGPGGMLSFDIPAGRAAGRRFIEATRVATLAPSLGSVETLVAHPASTTHRQLGADALAAAGIGEGMIRVSVGIEDAADLRADFEQALEAV